MTLEAVAGWVGTIAIFLLFAIKFYIAIIWVSFERSGRVALLWTSIYVFFLFILRVFSELGIGTRGQLRVLSGFAAIIPLVATLIQFYFDKRLGYKDFNNMEGVDKL